jgi:hypothetical protein
MARTQTWVAPNGSARRLAYSFRDPTGREVFIEAVALDAEAGATLAALSTASSKPTPATIPAGASGVGAAIDLAGTRLCGFILGAAWIAGTLSFDVSLDGATYAPLYNPADNTLVSYQVAASRAYAVDPALYAGWRFVRPKSSVNQTGGATITIAAQVV